MTGHYLKSSHHHYLAHSNIQDHTIWASETNTIPPD
jgi:hypothetical protein